MLAEVDLLLVIGSRNSSNSNRLVDVARAGGVASYLIDDESEIDPAWLEDVRTVGVTSGASAPEKLVSRVCDWFRARGSSGSSPSGWSTRTSPSGFRSSSAASSRSPRPARSRRRLAVDLRDQRLLDAVGLERDRQHLGLDPLRVPLDEVGVRGRAA